MKATVGPYHNTTLTGIAGWCQREGSTKKRNSSILNMGECSWKAATNSTDSAFFSSERFENSWTLQIFGFPLHKLKQSWQGVVIAKGSHMFHALVWRSCLLFKSEDLSVKTLGPCDFILCFPRQGLSHYLTLSELCWRFRHHIAYHLTQFRLGSHQTCRSSQQAKGNWYSVFSAPRCRGSWRVDQMTLPDCDWPHSVLSGH